MEVKNFEFEKYLHFMFSTVLKNMSKLKADTSGRCQVCGRCVSFLEDIF